MLDYNNIIWSDRNRSGKEDVSAGESVTMNAENFTTGLRVLYALLAIALLSGAASAANSTTGQIAVTSTVLDPEIFMPWDTGTLTVKVENTGQSAMTLGSADLISSSFQVLNYQTYDKIGTLGSGDSLTFTFHLKASGLEGVYFPELYLDLGDAGSLRYPVPVRVDATGILVSVLDVPDSFVQGEGNSIVLAVSNPRKNTVTSLTITPRGEGIRSTQTSIFVGSLEPDASKNVTFEITPDQSTDLTFDVSYANGMNQHKTSILLPISIGARSLKASPVVNNMELSQSGTTFTVKGDVTNAGLSDAKSVVATVGSPARAIDPNPLYVIGALEPDDFSSFEVTFTAQGASTVPLLIQYKDEEGRSYETSVPISLRTNSTGFQGSAANQGAAGGQNSPSFQPSGYRAGGPGGGLFGGFGTGLRNFPLTEIIVVIAAAVGLFVAWRTVLGPKLRARRARAQEKAKR